MTTQNPLKRTKLVLKKPFVLIISVVVLFVIGYFFGQLLFKIVN
jgi:hypothetical protein